MSQTIPDTTDSGTPPPERVTRIYTFGHDHVNPYTGESLAGTYVMIVAPDAETCRNLMLAVYGRNWSHEYVSVDAATRGGRFPMTESGRIELGGANETTKGA